MNSTTLNQPNPQSQQEIEQERQKATNEAQSSLDQDAIAAIEETRNAINALDQENTQDSIQALERATGKLDILLARYPELALVPVSTQITIIDLAPRDFDLIEPIRDEAKRAVNEEDFPTGRALLHNLVSEIRTSTVNLPLETYPDAMKEAARLLHQGRTDEARAVMQLALSTLVVTEQARPIPLINALTELAAAIALAPQGQDQQNQDQQNRDQVLRLLEDARTQLKLARELGYARRDPEYKELDRAIRDIERQIRAKEKTESPFAKLREKFSSFFNRVSRVNRPSHESQQTANA
ncbi:YfdX family protein [Phormidium sp. LEGE 05292]|uniref:YfdX family protein n=1 Tax=[Phormidium] sp. LEGE 05292 TaxID=767427 RepID=UPI001881A0B5|nr:YfdX family protein [Phormidium sp. LEGE 05292]MBE9228606.1 YfdX family protein [Phormidium sp. LEGE 05292]